MTVSWEPNSAPQERGGGAPRVVPVGRQLLAVSASLAAAYEEAADPVIVAERVWFGRVGDRLVVHMGQRVVVDQRGP